MKLTYDKEKVLKLPEEKEHENQERNSPFAAEIDAGDKHLDGIVEKTENSTRFHQLKELIEEEFDL